MKAVLAVFVTAAILCGFLYRQQTVIHEHRTHIEALKAELVTAKKVPTPPEWSAASPAS